MSIDGEELKDLDYKKAKDHILRLPRGPYWHNCVSLVLQQLAQAYSKELANKLIDDLKLDFEKA